MQAQNLHKSRTNSVSTLHIHFFPEKMSSISRSSPYETNCLQFSPKTLSSSPASTLNFNKSPKSSLQNSISHSATLESVIMPSDHITKSDLVDYFLTGCKPKPKWRIGTEHEKFGFDRKTLRPITYFQISQLLNTIAEMFNYEKILEDGVNVVGLKKNNLSITLEPGGQLELSGAPVCTIHEFRSEMETHLQEVKSVASEMGIAFCGVGLNPKWALVQIPVMPKSRYDIMTSYLPKIGSTGVDVMFRTCTVQVNLDYSSEADMVKKLRVSLALQPIATAIFANSPFSEGKLNGFVSKRSDLWMGLGVNRVGMLPFVFEEGFGFERYVEYMLDVPMFYVEREGKLVDCSGLSFRDFMRGELSILPGEYPTLDDWEVHLTTVFPEVRVKKFLEMRGADVGPVTTLCALPAFWVGLLYDEESLESAWNMIAEWTEEERDELRKNVPREGLRTGFRGGRVKEVAEEVVKMAREGLERRGLGEEVYLDGVREVVESGVTAAERLVEKFNGEWGRSVDPVFEELMY